jgi:hypothetical protein
MSGTVTKSEVLEIAKGNMSYQNFKGTISKIKRIWQSRK